MQDNSGPSRWGSEDTEFILVEWRVLSIILVLLVAFVVLSLLLAAWTLFFQGYIYSEPVSAIYWRAPAAGAALTLFLCIWVAFDYGSIHEREDEGRYQPLHNFSPTETITYKHLWITSSSRQDEHYVLQGNNQYVGPGGRRPPGKPLQIVASDKADGEKHVFKPQLDAKGNFKTEKGQSSLRYYEDGDPKKRYMEEAYPGQITIFHFGWLIMALFLNFGFLLVWFVSLWLLLQFQWPHALGLAFVAWLISLFILPMILTPAEKVRKERLPPKTTTASYLPQTRSGWLEAGMTQRFDRSGYEDQSHVAINRVAHDQGWNCADTNLARFMRQIDQRLAELRIDVETSINLLRGSAHLGAEPSFLRSRKEFSQLDADVFGIGHVVGNRGV
ncbi:MAG TPA: hypothetical protein VH682_03455 [Gemmataceae bacterium]|jgi:hypothetical protein